MRRNWLLRNWEARFRFLMSFFETLGWKMHFLRGLRKCFPIGAPSSLASLPLSLHLKKISAEVPRSLRGRLLLICEKAPVDRLIVFGRRCFPETEIEIWKQKLFSKKIDQWWAKRRLRKRSQTLKNLEKSKKTRGLKKKSRFLILCRWCICICVYI